MTTWAAVATREMMETRTLNWGTWRFHTLSSALITSVPAGKRYGRASHRTRIMAHGATAARATDLASVSVDNTYGGTSARVVRGHPRNALYQRRWFRVNVCTRSIIPAHHGSSSPSTRTQGCPN